MSPRRAKATHTAGSDDGLRARERLLEAGTQLFSERGYAATSVGAICERAEVGKPALYWHFESKGGLLSAVLDALVSRWIEALHKEAARAIDPRQQLQSMVGEMRRIVLEEPQLLRLPFLAALEQGSESARIRGAVLEIWERTGAAIADGTAAATGRPAEDFEGIAFVATSLHQAAAIRFSIDGDEERLERNLATLERAVRALLRDEMQ
jgi:AcrR family transcriptional regulator